MARYLKFLLIRHAESFGNIDRRLEGQMSTGLSPQGQIQAQQLGRYLQNQPAPTHLYSSPLRRAVETARVLAESVNNVSLQLEPLIQELHQGIFQGLTWSEASERYPELCAQLVATLDYQPVPEAETLAAAHRRAVTWYRHLWQHHQPGDMLWLVSHGGFMQQLIRVILGCDRTWQIPIGNTAIFEFWLAHPLTQPCQQDNPELWKIVKFNDISHLTIPASK
ncbi:MAG: histidine phosphatase family protein [Cyanobacteria bacterium P01_D01_bin.156]